MRFISFVILSVLCAYQGTLSETVEKKNEIVAKETTTSNEVIISSDFFKILSISLKEYSNSDKLC